MRWRLATRRRNRYLIRALRWTKPGWVLAMDFADPPEPIDGPFQEKDLRAFVSRHGILWLYSPPALPQYHGSVEAGVGSIKTRAHHEVARHDRPGQWTCDDIEAARPWGLEGPTLDETFQGRERVPPRGRSL